MSGNSMINLGELSKPATVLIEKIGDAIGGLFKPYQIKRIAKAEAEAQIIDAETQIQVTELHRRAMHRFVEEEAKAPSKYRTDHSTVASIAGRQIEARENRRRLDNQLFRQMSNGL